MIEACLLHLQIRDKERTRHLRARRVYSCFAMMDPEKLATWWKKLAAAIINDGYRRNLLKGFAATFDMIDGQELVTQV